MPKKYPVSDPRNWTQPFHGPIGRYVFEFGELEHAVDEAIVVILEPKHPTKAEMAISQILNLSARIQLLNALTVMTTKKRRHLNAMKRFTQKLADENAYRNNLVHGAWRGFSMQQLKRTERRWYKHKVHPRKMKYQTFSASPQEIESHRRKLKPMAARLLKLVPEIMYDRIGSAARRPPIDIPVASIPLPSRTRRRKPATPRLPASQAQA